MSFRLFDLNDPQLRAVKQTAGPVLILAGAGTGKTRTITARIAWMISQGIDPRSILAVTFTNKAAEEMRERAAGMVSKEAAKQLTISTFHSLCVRLLRQDIAKLGGWKENFAIYDQGDSTGLIRRIIQRVAAKDEKLEPSAAQAMISKAKNLGIDAPTGENAEQTLVGAVFARYQRELRQLNAVDFDDLLLLAVRLLRDHVDVREKHRARWNYLMVDEFQDTNRLQLDLVRLLAAGTPPNVCVVGDDDQSIYGWRGAEVSNILDFERHFPGATVIALEQNYRSTNHILNLANGVIRHNPRRRPKKLWSAFGDGEKPRLVAAPDEKAEAEFLVAEIHGRHLNDRVAWRDFAVLFRTNAQFKPVEEALRERGVPYRLVGGKSFFDRREVKDALAWIGLLANPDDDLALLRALQAPPRGIGEATLERLLAHSAAAGRPLWDSFANEAVLAEFPRRTREAIAAFRSFLETWEARILAPLADQGALARTMLTEAGFFEDLRKSCKTAEEADKREESVREILRDLETARSRGQTLQDFLDRLALRADRQQDESDGSGPEDGVTLITLHAAKGLEFPQVYVAGVEEGLLPHERSKAEGTLDEERRLFYVAVTRARERLTLLHCVARRRHGQALPRYPSSFLRELDPRHFERISFQAEMNKPATETTAKAGFARMRELLGK